MAAPLLCVGAVGVYLWAVVWETPGGSSGEGACWEYSRVEWPEGELPREPATSGQREEGRGMSGQDLLNTLDTQYQVSTGCPQL